MKELFKEHHRLANGELDEIWRTATFALDTNVLLNIYRYADGTRHDLFRVLTHLGDRVWVPYQVALEFYCNRLKVIREQADKYQTLGAAIASVLKVLADGAYSKSGFLDVPTLDKMLRPSIDNALKFIEERRTAHPDLVRNDPYLEKLVAVVREKIGTEPTEEQITKDSAEAQGRIDRLYPPGFADAKKPPPDRYGDVFIWFELLRLATATKRPVIFITDDDKEDWWLMVQGQKLGPRPELRREMRAKAGVEFQIYNPAWLLEQIGKDLKDTVKESSIADAKKITEELQTRQTYLDTSVLEALFGTENKPGYTLPAKTLARQAAVKWVTSLYPGALMVVASPGGGRVQIHHRSGSSTHVEIRSFRTAEEHFVRNLIAEMGRKAVDSAADVSTMLIIACRNLDAANRAINVLRQKPRPPRLEVVVGVVNGSFAPLERFVP